MTFAVNIAQGGSNNTTFRNRIINGAMVIDQRNNGASVSVSNGTIVYGADRTLVYEDTSASGCTVQQVTDAPAGFNYSLKFTVGTGGSATAAQLAVFEQRIEGFNFADFAFGTANAQPFTLSFWVKATATGTYCAAFRNASDNRSCVSTYTVNTANTWEYKTITVVGDTSGTWNTTNGIGISVRFDMGSGSNYRTSTLNAWQSGLFFSTSSQVNIIGTSSASLQITGVQLEEGTAASPFEFRQYGTELALCQRYYEKSYNQSVVPATVTDVGSFNTAANGVGSAEFAVRFAVPKRANPTVTAYNPATGTAGQARDVSNATNVTANLYYQGESGLRIAAGFGANAVGNVHMVATAEL